MQDAWSRTLLNLEGRPLLKDTLVRTLAQHYCMALLSATLEEHSCVTLLSDTLQCWSPTTATRPKPLGPRHDVAVSFHREISIVRQCTPSPSCNLPIQTLSIHAKGQSIAPGRKERLSAPPKHNPGNPKIFMAQRHRPNSSNSLVKAPWALWEIEAGCCWAPVEPNLNSLCWSRKPSFAKLKQGKNLLIIL